MAFLSDSEVQGLLVNADQVIDPDDIFPVDSGVVLRRHVGPIDTGDSLFPQPFIKWFHQHVIQTLLNNSSKELESLPVEERILVLAGRAGQGKSTLMRHVFLHIKRQWDEENHRIQPNFGEDRQGTNLDDSFSEFYQKFVDRTHYLQARTVYSQPIIKGRGSHLVLFDGIDEADTENLGFIHTFMKNHPHCVFLLSSRTRRQSSRLNPRHEEIINLDHFRGLCDEKKLRNKAAMLHPMDEREKKDMMHIMEDHEPERDFSFLKTLVENNSQSLKVPADFLLYRAKSPKTKSEYYLHHLRWLIDREDSKDVKERKRLISQFRIPLENELSFARLSDGRVNLTLDTPNLASYQMFNLLETQSIGQTEEHYFDLETSSAKALVLLSIGGISAHTFLSNEVSPEGSAIKCVKALLFSKFGQGFIQAALKEIHLHSYSSNIHEPLACMLNGHGSMIEGATILGHLPNQTSNNATHLKTNVNYLLWLIDALHPLDELDVGFKSEPYHPLISKNVECLFELEEEHHLDPLSWLDERIEHWYRLLMRMSQQGPGLEHEESLERIISSHERSTFIHRFVELIAKIVDGYSYKMGAGTNGIKEKFHGNSEIKPYLKNTKSRQRVFATICGVLSVEVPYNRFEYIKIDCIVKYLENHSTYPEMWPVHHFIEWGNTDLVYSQFSRMDQESQDRERIIQYFVDIGLDPNLSYYHLYNNRDMLLRSVKFLSLANRELRSSRLDSIVKSYIAMSRMGHMGNKWNNLNTRNRTTFKEDINKYAWNSNRGEILEDYDKACAPLLNFFSEIRPYPPIFHTIITPDPSISKQKQGLRLYNLNFLKEIETIYPRVDYRKGDLPKLMSPENINSLLKLNPPEFLEQYAAFSSLIPQHDTNKSLSSAVHDGLIFWLERGQYLVALVYALRTSRVDVVSILLHATLDEEDGFDQMRSKMIGNYLHRRVYSAKPDHWDFEKSLLNSLKKSNIPGYEEFFADSIKTQYATPIKGYMDETIPFVISNEELRKFVEVGKISFTKKEGYREVQFIADGRPRTSPRDRIFIQLGYKIRAKTEKNTWRWLTTNGKYWSKIQVQVLMKLFLDEHFGDSDLRPSEFSYPPNVGSMLDTKQTRIFSSWHVIPYFSKYFADLNDLDFDSFCVAPEHVKISLTQHATQDEHLVTGMSFHHQASPFTSLEPHDSVDAIEVNGPYYSAGLRNIIIDEFSKEKGKNKSTSSDDKNEEMELVSFDLRMHPPGFRTLMEGYKHIFDIKKEEHLNPESENSKDFFLASSYLSSMKYSHSLTNQNKEKSSITPHGWLTIGYITPRMENPVYGYKFGIYGPHESEDEIEAEGFGEYTMRSFTSKKKRKILSTFVEVMDDEWVQDNRYAHSSWKSLLLESEDVPQLLEDAMNISEESKGLRAKRVFGVVVDHGRIDQYALDCVNDAMKKLEVNLQQLKNKQRVLAGRENLVNAIREFSVVYLHCDWLPGYVEAFTIQRQRMESIMSDIEAEERKQMGKSLEGTAMDFTTIKAMLEGLRYKANQKHQEVEEDYTSLIKKLGDLKFKDPKGEREKFDLLKPTIRRLCLYLDTKEKRTRLMSALSKAFLSRPQYEIKRHCRPRRRMKVRVLGMPQGPFPYAILTSWDEVVGSLFVNDEDCQVGTIVRLDIKPLRRAGNSKVIVANIAAAVDELDSHGKLREAYNGEWPKPLKKTNTLPLVTTDKEIMDGGDKFKLTVPMYIKPTKTHACHPELDIDIPVFKPNDVDEQFKGQLRRCTVDIRRDRKSGLFRYYVITVK
tara:strand:- start:18 stop:5327 length:5310 start_codon:yes stop_codon:yes gene_type:complete